MTERSTVSQVVQIGVESTSGTAVAASKRLSSLSIEPNISADVNRFRPQGSKYETVAAIGKEWTTASVSGVATYDEIIYPLSSALTAGVHTTLGANAGEQWVFTPSTFDEDTPKTFTVEYGSSVRAHKFAYGIFTEFGIDLNRDACNLSGAMMGQRITDGVTLTSSPTTVPLVPMLPNSFDVYVDAAFGDIGTTKLGRLVSWGWKVGNRVNPLWVVDSSKSSWVAHVETVPSVEITMLMEADSAGMAYLSQLRSGGKSFLQVKSTGPALGGSYSGNYSYTQQHPIRIVGTNGFSDSDGVYAIAWTATVTPDDDLGGSTKATVVNTLSAL